MAQILIITSKKYINRHSKKGIINRYNSNSNNRLLKLIRLKRNGIQHNKNKHANRSYMESPKVEFSNIIIQEVPDENTGFAKPYFYNGSFSSSSSTLDEDAYGGLNDINNIISSNNNTLDTSGGLEVEVAECIVLTPGEEILHRAELQEYINSQRDHTVFAMVECDSELERSDSGFLQSSNFDPNSGSTSNFNSFEDLGSLPGGGRGGGGGGGRGGGGSSRGAGFSGYFVEEPELIQHRGTESEYFGNNPVGYTYSSYQVEEVVDDDDISENDIDMF